MKLLSVKQARSIWFLYLIELNPRGLNLTSLIKPFVEKYNFQIYPNKPEELGFGKENIEIKFIGGNFRKTPGDIIDFNLSIYNDGLILDTRSSTYDSDTILDDILNWTSSEYGFVPYYEILIRRAYVSELYVQSNKSMNMLNPKLSEFSKQLTSLVVSQEKQHKYETTSIAFWTDQSIANPPGAFRFERVLNVPFNTNRYYSAAPLQTDDHIKMLEKLEKILGN
jgi:hypothetical protein